MRSRRTRDQQQDVLQRERQLAVAVRACLVGFEGVDIYTTTLEQVLASLDELFLLVIVGEFNAGKSALINALLRAPVLEEGVTPTTAKITKVRYGVENQRVQLDRDTVEQCYPADFLRNISIVDTPGINAVLREHERMTKEFIPRSDLILFVTSADRSFTESERQFLESIRGWGKKVLIVLNKADLLRTTADVIQVTSFIDENCRKLLGFQPEIFPVSVLEAQQSHTAMGHEAIRLWESSRIGALEDYLFLKLDEGERARLKLLSPLGVLQRLSAEIQGAVEQRASLLTEDERTVRAIEGNLQQYRKEMEENFSHRLGEIENIVLEMGQRGDRFFDDTMRLTRSLELIRADKIRQQFEETVIGDSAARIDGMVRDLTDWLTDQEQKFRQFTLEYVDRRRKESSVRDDQMIGSINRQFDYNRNTLLRAVFEKASELVKAYDRQQEAEIYSKELQKAVVQTLVVGAGGLTLGTIGAATAAAVGFTFLDLTGITAGVVVVILGIFILPARKASAKRKFDEKMQELRQRLHNLMNEQFNKELNGSIQRVYDALAPYIRFVHTEQEKVTSIRQQITPIEADIMKLKGTIEQM
ncbi:MAG TPA: dynamin [Ktedonobacter sp.]|nr:dynamin [Ktedonobacter sp.]